MTATDDQPADDASKNKVKVITSSAARKRVKNRKSKKAKKATGTSKPTSQLSEHDSTLSPNRTQLELPSTPVFQEEKKEELSQPITSVPHHPRLSEEVPC